MAVPYFLITKEGIIAFDSSAPTNTIIDAATYTYVVASNNAGEIALIGAETGEDLATAVETYKTFEQENGSDLAKITGSFIVGDAAYLLAGGAGWQAFMIGLAASKLWDISWDFSRDFWHDYPGVDDSIPLMSDAEISQFLKGYYDNGLLCVSIDVNTDYGAAYGWRQPRYDPLTLDLDGDGLETVGINPSNPILFDHDGDGIKTGTGWVKPDDGFLVLDRNGNGTIDSGREMFGDATLLEGGGTAADGFAALVEEDTNADGRVDALDARFAQLRIWRDLNQNGLSEAGELSTLDAAGIVAIRTAKTEHSAMLANGNQIADKGAYVRADGTEGALVEVTGDLADINLANNSFYSEFTGAITPVKEVQALPDFRSGQMWDGLTVIYKQAA